MQVVKKLFHLVIPGFMPWNMLESLFGLPPIRHKIFSGLLSDNGPIVSAY